jgi:hypothetical protein
MRLLLSLLLTFFPTVARANPIADALARPALPIDIALPLDLASHEILLFRLPDTTETLLAETRSLAPGADPMLRLRDANGRILAVRSTLGKAAAFDLVLVPRPPAPAGTHWTLSEAARGEPAALPLRLVLETRQRVVVQIPDPQTDLLAIAHSLDRQTDPVLALVDADDESLGEDNDGQGRLDAGMRISHALAEPLYLRLTTLVDGPIAIVLEESPPDVSVATVPSNPEAARSAPPLISGEILRLRLRPQACALCRLPDRAWRARTRDLQGETDTLLHFLAPDGRILAEDDDGSGGLASCPEIPSNRPAGSLLEATTFDGVGGVFSLILEPAL